VAGKANHPTQRQCGPFELGGFSSSALRSAKPDWVKCNIGRDVPLGRPRRALPSGSVQTPGGFATRLNTGHLTV
jgi:hypothetical protein